jgi:hypothetical protein
MPDGNGPGKGYEITVNGAGRTFRDRKATAIDAAQALKAKGKTDIVKVFDCTTGEETLVLADGRLG